MAETIHDRYVKNNWYNTGIRNIKEANAPSWQDVSEARPEDSSLIEQHRNALMKNPRMNGDGSISTVYIRGVSGPEGRIHNIPGYDYETGERLDQLDDRELYEYWNQKGRIKDFNSFAPDEGQLANEQAQRIHEKWIDPDMEAYGLGEHERHKLANTAIKRGVMDATGEPIQNMSPADAAKNYAGAADWALRMRDNMPEWMPSGVRSGLARVGSEALAQGYQGVDFLTDIAPMGLGNAWNDYRFDIGGNIAGIRDALQDPNANTKTPDELIPEGLAYGYKQR